MFDLARVQRQVREVLKSIGNMKPGGVAMDPPDDPDALDERLGGAAPTEEGMQAAGEEAAAGQGAGQPGEGEGGSSDEPEKADEEDDEEGEDAGEGDGRPVEKALPEGDVFGNHDFSPEEIRALEKAYGNGTGQAEPNDLLKGGPDLETVLDSILHAMEEQGVVLQALHDEVTSLKAGQTATNRKLSKAMADLAPAAGLEAPPVPLAAPKAITKSFPVAPAAGPGANVPALTPDQIFAQMKTGQLSQDAAMAHLRQARGIQ